MAGEGLQFLLQSPSFQQPALVLAAVVMWMPPSCLAWARHWTLVSVPGADGQSLMRPLGQAVKALVLLGAVGKQEGLEPSRFLYPLLCCPFPLP